MTIDPMRGASSSLIPWADQRTPALAIVARGDQIRTVTPTTFEVQSQSRPGRRYAIVVRREHWSCSCQFYRETRLVCIHIRAVQFRERCAGATEKGPPHPTCPRCGSGSVIHFGRRHNRAGAVSRYRCRTCASRFTDRAGALHLRQNATTVALALDLFFRGLSLRKVSDHLWQAHGLVVAPSTVYEWVVRGGPGAARWMDSLGARTGERWHIDETQVKTDGNPRWVWNVVDAETRFLIATHFTKLRRVRDARLLLRRAKAATPDRPLSVLTDGMPAYRKAIGRELAFRSGAEVVNPHLRVPSIRAKTSNNLVERFQGSEKDRLKVMRGLHGRTAPKWLLDGMRVHYNLVRPHSTLGSTPGAAAGLPALGRFRWEEILKRSPERVPRGEVEIELVVR